MGLFGIGDGAIDLQLKNVNVASGETIEGTVTLTLNADVKGKQVIAILFAEKTETSINQGQQITRTIKIYTRSVTLDTEKLYTKQNSPYQYKLSFVIPQMTTTSPEKGANTGIMGGLFGGSSRFGGSSTSLTRWYLKVEFEHETMMSFPIEKTQEIDIVARPQQPVSGQI